MLKPMVGNLGLAGCPRKTPSQKGRPQEILQDLPGKLNPALSPETARRITREGGMKFIRCLSLNSPRSQAKAGLQGEAAKPSFLLTLLELTLQQETRCHKTEKSPVRGHRRFHSFTRALSLHRFPITSWPPLSHPLIPTWGHPRT